MVLQTVGPSGMDTQSWRCLCTSLKEDLAALCNSLAKVCKRVLSAYMYVDLEGLTAFVACRLMALDKCPCVRPIDIREVVQCIIRKVILITISKTKSERLLAHCRSVLVIKPGPKQPFTP